jgi:leucyl aminopeptidase (aminopeptidase T)
MKNFRLKKEHDKVAKAAAKAAAETAFDYAYTAAYAATFSEDYAIGCAAAAARDAYFAASTEADEDVIAKAKAEEEHYKPIKRQPSQKRLRVVSAPESRERMKKAMQDLGMTEELKLFFGEE